MSSEHKTMDVKLVQTISSIIKSGVCKVEPSTDVVIKIIRNKMSSSFSEEYLESRKTLIASVIGRVFKDYMGSQPSGLNQKKADNDDDGNEDDDDDDEDDDDYEESDEEESESDEEEFDSDEEGFESDEESAASKSSEKSGDGNSGEVSDRKRKRSEEPNESASENKDADVMFEATESHDPLSKRCEEMLYCLKKLSYKPRDREGDEPLQTYIDDCLIPLFKKHNLDPEKYSKADIKRYERLKEVELLQKDGAQIDLDRRARRGRGEKMFASGLEDASKAAFATSKFLNDD